VLAASAPGGASAAPGFASVEAPILSVGGAPGVSSGLQVALCVVDPSELGHCFPPPVLSPLVFVADPALVGLTIWRGRATRASPRRWRDSRTAASIRFSTWTTIVPVSGAAGSIVTEPALLGGQVGPSGVDLFGYGSIGSASVSTMSR
jgi:hypothetical protein